MKKLILITALICFSLPAFAKLDVGDTAFDFLGRKNGDEVLVSHYRGKLVIVTFWATWCKYCMKELPVLSGIQNHVGTDKLQVIAVSHRESKKMFTAVSKSLAESKMVLAFDKGKSSKKYDVGGIPHMVIIDKQGKIAAVHIGYTESDLPQLVEEINALLRDQ